MKGALLVRNYAFIHNGELLAEMPDGLRSFNEASAALLKKDAVLPFSAKTSDHPGWPGGKVFVIAPVQREETGVFRLHSRSGVLRRLLLERFHRRADGRILHVRFSA
jgi:hypothetical protein